MIYQIRHSNDTDWEEIVEDNLKAAINEFCAIVNSSLDSMYTVEVRLPNEKLFTVYEIIVDVSIRATGEKVPEDDL